MRSKTGPTSPSGTTSIRASSNHRRCQHTVCSNLDQRSQRAVRGHPRADMERPPSSSIMGGVQREAETWQFTPPWSDANSRIDVDPDTRTDGTDTRSPAPVDRTDSPLLIGAVLSTSQAVLLLKCIPVNVSDVRTTLFPYKVPQTSARRSSSYFRTSPCAAFPRSCYSALLTIKKSSHSSAPACLSWCPSSGTSAADFPQRGPGHCAGSP